MNGRRGQNLKYLPHVFTEHGAIQAANGLNSSRAIAMSVCVVRAFVRLRAFFTSNKTLARKLVSLEGSPVALDAKTQRQPKELYDLIRLLMDSPPAKPHGIGFTADPEEE